MAAALLAACSLVAWLAVRGGVPSRLQRPVTAEALQVVRHDTYVELDSLGWIRGIGYPTYRLFLGIPYGQAQRWEPGEPAQAWRPRTLSANHYGPVCPASSYDFSMEKDMHMFSSDSYLVREAKASWRVDEQCLFLNVYAPMVGHEPCPVLVWFHGGSFIMGAGSDATSNDVAILALRGIVVVTVNSRLGAFGFLMGEALRDPGAAPAANFGFLDQRLALQWVQRHISAFGGDPERVTIMGWSSGAASISAHLTMGRSAGLFHAAIMQSGAFASWFSSAAEAEATFGSLVRCLGCEPRGPRREVAACARGAAAERVVACERALDANSFMPVVDGVELFHDSPADAMASDDVRTSVPIIIGSTRYDGLVDLGLDATRPDLRAYFARQCFPTNATLADAAYRIYDPGQGASPTLGWSASYWRAREMQADRSLTCIARRVARRWALDGRAPAFWYEWNYDAPMGDRVLQRLARKDLGLGGRREGSCWPCPGAGHGSELPFLFRDHWAVEESAAVDRSLRVTDILGATLPVDVLLGDGLADAAQELWVRFVKNHTAFSTGSERTARGTPLPAWTPVRADASGVGPALVIEGSGLLSPLVTAYKAEQCTFWERWPC